MLEKLTSADERPTRAPTATRAAPRRRSAPAPPRAGAGRAPGWPSAVVALAAVAGLAMTPLFHHAVREIALPLRHEDIIRQQAREKGLDPALIAAVIYAESHFRDGQTLAGRRAGA